MDALKIVQMLGYRALALDQGGAYIRARGLSLSNFIFEYNRCREKAFKEVPDQWEY